MFRDNDQGADASNVPYGNNPLPEHDYDNVNHILYGSLSVIRKTILILHTLQYAEPNDWTRPLPTGRPNEMMSMLTKRVRLD